VSALKSNDNLVIQARTGTATRRTMLSDLAEGSTDLSLTPDDRIEGARLQPRSVACKHMTGSPERGPIMPGFDYNAAAELFPTRIGKHRPVGYRRFARAADAIRFAIEELPPELLIGTCLEVDEQRYGSDAIHRLYQSADYPIVRRAAA
jgi:hypothetical protein